MKIFNLQEAIEKRRIIYFSNGPKLVREEIKAGREDLQDAKYLFSKDRFKSATTLAYRAIFHAGRALLYKKEYREKSHIQLVFAIKHFYADDKLFPQEFHDNFFMPLAFARWRTIKISIQNMERKKL